MTGPTTVNLLFRPANDPRCSKVTGAIVCQIRLALETGSYTANISAYDKAPASGALPSGAHLLSTARDVPVTIVLAHANRIAFTLAGVVASLAVSGLPSASHGTAFTSPQTFTVTAYDRAGYVIAGPYENPVVVSDGDTSGGTRIATSGNDNPPAGALVSSSDKVTLNYNGVGDSAITITASAVGATSANATFFPAELVSLDTDSNPGAPAGTGGGGRGTGTGAGVAGDLRNAMLQALPGQRIVFGCGNPCTILLHGPLPPIEHDVAIDGGTFGNVIINGVHVYRVFWVDTGNVTLAHLQVQNAEAIGGPGGSLPGGDAGCAGGGGAGLGAALFVNQAAANVTVMADYFVSDAATGGVGGTGATTGATSSDAGGGGLSGNETGSGGNGAAGTVGGGGGGGVYANGNVTSTTAGAAGGAGGGGGGTGYGNSGGTAGAAYGSNAAGSNGASPGAGPGVGGNGGVGGGGGGSWASNNTTSGAGGAGGLGGGGGGGEPGGNGGPGGGGGGGGSVFSIVGGGTFGGGGGGGALATLSGGSGDDTCNGGGGAAAGPAIFVNAGTLSTSDSGATSSSATAGAAGGGTATAGTADATPVFNYSGTVNGSTTTGPIVSALGTSAPSLPRIPYAKNKP